jgi:hypothetical protein
VFEGRRGPRRPTAQRYTLQKYICIDIPPENDLMMVRQFMIDNNLMFKHADPTYDELFPDEN